MKKNIFRIAAVLLTLIFPISAFAATCFWVPIVVTGAVSGTGGVCRLTITAITGSGLVAGDSVIVAGVTGATGCNVTATISTVVDSTHIELTGTTFGGSYVSGGTVAGGHWTTTNTAMWASGTGGTVGTCAATGGVPKQSADTATFDGSSGGGVIIVDSTMNGTTLSTTSMGAYNGTIDFSVNNPSMTFSGGTTNFSISGTGTRTIKLGSGTFSINGAANQTPWDAATTTNLTFNAGTSNITITGGSSLGGTSNINTGGLTYATFTINARTAYSPVSFSNSTPTFTTLNLNAPCTVLFTSGTTTTITNAVNWSGSSSNQFALRAGVTGTIATLAVASGSTISWAQIASLTFTGTTVTATNSFNGTSNTGVTITAPASGGGAPPMIGGT